MKRIAMAAIILLLINSVVFNAAEIDNVEEYTGVIMQVSGVWFLQTSDNLLGLEIGELVSEEGTQLQLAIKDTITAKGILQETTFSAREIILKDIIYKLKVVELEESDYKGYQVTASRCIGCRLCVKNCPVGAISMQKGKAVIDPEKCIQCGICQNGDTQAWKGCPVGAIGKTK